jgi:hypothetical protein
MEIFVPGGIELSALPGFSSAAPKIHVSEVEITTNS